MLFSTEVVLAACVGVAMAGPHHLHRHRDVHAKKDLADVDWKALDWDSFSINWEEAWSKGQATATVATPVATSTTAVSVTPTASPIIAAAKAKATTTSTAAKAAATSSSDLTDAVDSVISDVKTLFSSIVGMSNKLTSFGGQTGTSGSVISKIGNIGSPEGSNIIKVDSREGYDFTNKFVNTASEAITVIIWNKAATSSSGTVEANLGSCIALETPALSFTLAKGASQIVAFDNESQVGWAQATSRKTLSGAAAITWGEANFVSTGCGYDVSSIVNSLGNTYDMAISSEETPCISDMTQNNWIARNNNPEDPIPIGDSDGSCYIPGSKATLTTNMGGDV